MEKRSSLFHSTIMDSDVKFFNFVNRLFVFRFFQVFKEKNNSYFLFIIQVDFDLFLGHFIFSQKLFEFAKKDW